MKKRLVSFLLVMCMVFSIAPFALAAQVPTQEEAYAAMIALKDDYPEGTPWTNDNYYAWNGGIYTGGFGCAGFAFILSDAAFGDLPARIVEDVTIDDVRVGDILRQYNDTHSVIVLEVHSDYVVLAEGNFNSSVHWGRKLTAEEVADATYLMTRYPEETKEEKPQPSEPTESDSGFSDVVPGSFYEEAVAWAVENEITNGMDDGTFAPMDECIRAQVVTFLWRACGSPEPNSTATGFSDVPANAYYAKAVAWAVENSITNGMGDGTFGSNESCTRAQVATFLWRAANKPAVSGGNPFTDTVPGEFYYDAVLWAAGEGITTGTTTTTFSPAVTCNRAQIVTFLHRYMTE